jgi:site-specific DNA-methyltransferase (adenine-specific)
MIPPNSIHHGDCLEVMKDIPDKSIDMILCDLPYGTTACKWDTIIPFEPLWEQYKRIIKERGAIVLTASQPFTSMLGASNLPMLKYSWVWDKYHGTGHLNAKKQPLKGFEDILVFYTNPPTYNPQGIIYNPKLMKNSHSDCERTKKTASSVVTSGIKNTPYIQEYENYPKGIISIKSENGNKLHPTMKPVALFEYLIKTYTNEGDIVLDNCAGSGTTGVACINTNRKYILIEKEEKYIDIIKSRIQQVTVPLSQFMQERPLSEGIQ